MRSLAFIGHRARWLVQVQICLSMHMTMLFIAWINWFEKVMQINIFCYQTRLYHVQSKETAILILSFLPRFGIDGFIRNSIISKYQNICFHVMGMTTHTPTRILSMQFDRICNPQTGAWICQARLHRAHTTQVIILAKPGEEFSGHSPQMYFISLVNFERP